MGLKQRPTLFALVTAFIVISSTAATAIGQREAGPTPTTESSSTAPDKRERPPVFGDQETAKKQSSNGRVILLVSDKGNDGQGYPGLEGLAESYRNHDGRNRSIFLMQDTAIPRGIMVIYKDGSYHSKVKGAETERVVDSLAAYLDDTVFKGGTPEDGFIAPDGGRFPPTHGDKSRAKAESRNGRMILLFNPGSEHVLTLSRIAVLFRNKEGRSVFCMQHGSIPKGTMLIYENGAYYGRLTDIDNPEIAPRLIDFLVDHNHKRGH